MKPCPFCGETDIKHHASVGLGRRFKCSRCHAEGPPARMDIRGATQPETDRLRRDEAARLWNGRCIASRGVETGSAIESPREMSAMKECVEALDNLLMALELPGNHCELEQAKPRARSALSKLEKANG